MYTAPGVRQVPEGSENQRQMEGTGCEVICGTLTTLAVTSERINPVLDTTDALQDLICF